MKKYSSLLAVLFVGAILFVFSFKGYIDGKKVMLTTDAMISHSDVSFSEMVSGIGPQWKETPLIGSPRGGGSSIAWITKGFFSSGILWNNLFYGTMCLASFLVLSTYLRRRGLSLPASICSAMAAVWLGSNFTLLYPGHGHKPVVILFFICSLLPIARAAAGSVVFSLIWGACIGLMFVQQPDVALFFALFAGSFFVFQLWKVQGFKPLRWLKVLVPAAVVAFLFAVGPLLSGYENHVKGTAQMETKNPQQKWDYVTQWSVPPNEVVDFVAPGYFGWRSGEPEGPYWGRMGRSPGWEKTKQGFRNFKLESTYIGIIPVGFAIFALFAYRRSKHRSEILFWAGATVVSLLLAFGKYFPLYALFYKLPVVNNIRNPNKFIQIFQVCMAILAAYGFDALWRSKASKAPPEDGLEKPVRIFFWSSLGVLVVMGLWALIATLGKEGGIGGFVSEGWPQEAAQAIVQNKAGSLWHAVFMTAVVTGVFAVFSFNRFSAAARYRNTIAAVLVLIVAVDAVKLSRQYIKEMPRSYIQANTLTDYLKENLGNQRVALLSQDGINNIWITYLMPYNRIATFNFTDMPRMATDYKAFLLSGQRDPFNMWRRSAVKYLLAPAEAQKQLAAAGCRKVFAYGLSAAAGGFKVMSHPSGALAVYELQGALPRYALFAGSIKGTDEQALAGMSDYSRLVVSGDSALPELSGKGMAGSVIVLSDKVGKVHLRVKSDVPVILRAADRYDTDWKAKLDGKSAEVGRVDYIFQGVSVPAGEHEVVLRYAPSRFYFNLQLLGCTILAAALIMAWKRRNGSDVAD